MPSDKVPGKSVFVGNIPYGVSEEQIIDIFSRVGQVVGFRLVHDKETGRPKGFGFLEYQDVDTAAAAVRNLNDHDIMGRKLRVDWSNDSGSGGATAPSHTVDTTTAHHLPPNGVDAQQGALPPLPPGIETTLSAPDAISQTLSAMPAPQLLDLISQMKGMVADNPAQVAQLFQVAPQLAYAIFQALLLLGLTDTSILSSIVQAAAASTAPPPPQQPVQVPPPVVVPPPQMNPYGAAQQVPFPMQSHTPVPMAYPPQQQAYVPPPQPVTMPPPQQQQAPGGQEALIAQLMAMTRDQILGLPPPQRDQILQLRAQLGNPVT